MPIETPKVAEVLPAVDAPPESPISTTVEGYVVPKGEEGLFHIEMQPAGAPFDPETGKKRYKPYVQKFHPRDFAIQISMNDRGEPVYATVGNRYNKILHVPAANLLEGVAVNVVMNRKTTKIPITEALIRIEKIIANQPK